MTKQHFLSRRNFLEIALAISGASYLNSKLYNTRYPFDMCAPENLHLFTSYSNIHASDGKPRFNHVYWQDKVIVGGKTYTKCIEMHPTPSSVSTVVFQLPLDARRLKCKFGLARQDSNPAAKGDFSGKILIDGKSLWEEGVIGTSDNATLYEIDIDFSKYIPAYKLEFQVDSNGSNGADQAVWLEPTLYGS